MAEKRPLPRPLPRADPLPHQLSDMVNRAPCEVVAEIPIMPAPFGNGGPSMVCPAIRNLPLVTLMAGDWAYLHSLIDPCTPDGHRTMTFITWRNGAWARAFVTEPCRFKQNATGGPHLAKYAAQRGGMTRTQFGMPYGAKMVAVGPNADASTVGPNDSLYPRAPMTPSGTVRARGSVAQQLPLDQQLQQVPSSGSGSGVS